MEAVEGFILEKDEPQRSVLSYLHERMLSYPEIHTKIRYKIPFYFKKSWICYLNPIKNDGIEMVFLRGNELSNEQGLLDTKGRKQVAGIEFYKVEDIPIETLMEVIEEAILLDEMVPYASKNKKRK